MDRTQVKVYNNDDGDLCYDFIIDKDHIESLKGSNVWNSTLDEAWKDLERLKDYPFFHRAFRLSLIVQAFFNKMLLGMKQQETSTPKVEDKSSPLGSLNNLMLWWL